MCSVAFGVQYISSNLGGTKHIIAPASQGNVTKNIHCCDIMLVNNRVRFPVMPWRHSRSMCSYKARLMFPVST